MFAVTDVGRPSAAPAMPVTRVALDVVCLIVGAAMLVRLRPRLVPGALVRGSVFIAALWGANTVSSVWFGPALEYDLVMGATVLSVTIVSRGRWEAAVPAAYRRDGVEGLVRRQSWRALSLGAVMLVIYFGMEAVTR